MTAALGVQMAAQDWARTVAERVGAGMRMLDLLTAVDRPDGEGPGGTIEVVLHLVDPGPPMTEEFLHVVCDRESPVLDSLVAILPAAAWHEREIHEMFGVDFVGHPDLRPLLLAPGPVATPLRKDVRLEARGEEPRRGRR